MKNDLYYFTLVFITVFSALQAQEKEKLSALGGPILELNTIGSNLGFAIGGKGGAIFNEKFAFGGMGKSLIKEIDFKNNTEVSYGVGGIFTEYFIYNNKNRISIPINFLIGGISIKDKKSDVKIESSRVCFIESGVNFRIKVSNFLSPTIYAIYRLSLGSSLDTASNNDFSGFAIGTHISFGNF